MGLSVSNLNNTYFDFQGFTVNYQFLANVAFSNDSIVTTRSIDYFLDIINNSVLAIPQKIDPNGNIVTSGLSFTASGVSSLSKDFNRVITGLGRQKDEIVIYELSRTLPNPEVARRTFDFVVLQKASPITQRRDIITNSIIGFLGNNSSINAVTSTSYRLDKSLNRGDEVVSEWIILKYDPNSGTSPVPAIINVDYQLLTGISTSDVIEIKFLNNTFNYKVQNYCAGYTFDSNPYWVYPLDTEFNNNLITHNFILVTPTSTFEVLFPQLDMSVTISPIDNELSTDPITTYQNQPITIQAVILNSTGYWKKKVIGFPDDFVSKTDLEWQTEMITRCNVILEAKEKDTGIVVQSKSGFGPLNIILKNVNDYIFQYNVTLK